MKLKLKLEDLAIDSFEVLPEAATKSGTVLANAAVLETAGTTCAGATCVGATCNYQTCAGPSCANTFCYASCGNTCARTCPGDATCGDLTCFGTCGITCNINDYTCYAYCTAYPCAQPADTIGIA